MKKKGDDIVERLSYAIYASTRRSYIMRKSKKKLMFLMTGLGIMMFATVIALALIYQ